MRTYLLALILSALLPLPGWAATPPRIVLIIDDMGNHRELGERALQLPGPLHFAFLPHSPNSADQARRAHQSGNEVMVHAPMETVGAMRLGPGGLRREMSEAQFRYTLGLAINSVPHARGVNNHMGSLLTQLQRPMDWLMATLKQRQLYFIDSRTSDKTVAEKRAAAHQLPHLHRDIFLDNERRPSYIARQFEQLLARAQRNGVAVGIGHPYPETIAFLERALPMLGLRGFQLVTASTLLSPQPENCRPGVFWEVVDERCNPDLTVALFDTPHSSASY